MDVLIELEPGVRIGLLALAGMQVEFEELIGRRVDLVTPGGLHPEFAQDVLDQAEAVYVRR